jgi:hypothetical protein
MGGSEGSVLKKDKHEKFFLRTLQERILIAIKKNFTKVKKKSENILLSGQ